MKKILIATSFAMLLACEKKVNSNNTAESQQQKEVVKKDSIKNKIPSSINEIKAEFSVINNQIIAKKMDSSSFDYECDEISGNVVYYTENGELKSIKHFHGDSHFSSVEKYYLKEDKAFFIYQEDTLWNFDGGTPEKPETKDDIEEKRYYYANEKIILCRDKKYTVRTKNGSKPENISDGESKNCNDAELKKTLDILLKNKDKKGKINCIL